MPVVELLVSAFLPVLLQKLTSPELLQFLRQEGLYSKIKKWEKMLLLIEAVLADAEEKQLTKTAVKTWLDDLRELAYDAEDMLDEFATEAIARNLKMKEQQASKVWKLVPACFSNWSLGAIKFHIRMRSIVKDVTSRSDQLCKLRQDLGLKAIIEGTSSSDAAPLRQPTTSQPIEAAVYGRDEDKKKILEMVLNDANFLVIPIVGMGGVGKTTLAREVFNDSEVESFEVKAWVCVSDGYFDCTRISKSILDNITGGSSSGQKDLDTVLKELKHIVNGKKFLLVLDDVWSIDDANWEILKSPFRAGALRSRIIVTTRLQEKALNYYGFHPLDVLSDEDCWSVFSKSAFKDNEANLAHRDMELIREKVVEKSKGLPLAAKTLAGLLRSEHIDGWLKILNSSLWDLSENYGIGIPAVLKLSYHYLSSHLKRCFTYCAIFPKDYEFKKEELVLLWMAEGLLQQSTNTKQTEDFGGECVYALLSRSLFQQSSSDNSKFVMHDLVHDLAQWGFGQVSLRLDNEMGANKIPKELQRVRHFSYTVDYCDGKSKFEVFKKELSLRTFLPISQYESCGNYITNMILFDMLPKLKTLRALSLRTYHITELPNSIGGLKHLRYLNLAYTEIRSLPESTTSLYNLQILLLTGCYNLKKLPSNFRNLINLRHLDIRGASSIAEMPVGLKELKSLQKLSDFIVGKNTCSTLKDLKSLEFIRGELCISRLNNVIDCDPRDLILRDKDLKELSLDWGSEFEDPHIEVAEENVLDILRPHQNLQKLTISCYGGTRFPPWVGDPSFSSMVFLRLENCEKCEFLPSLGLLRSLRHLCIKGMTGLERIGSEIYGNYSVSFPSLEILHFEGLEEWKQWDPATEDQQAKRFPCLQELSIIDCPKLTGTLPNHLPSLEKLVIRECKNMLVSVSNFPMLCELEIDICNRVLYRHQIAFESVKSIILSKIINFGNWPVKGFQKVEHLKVVGCENLICLWQNEFCLEKLAPGMHSLTFLRELSIENCPSLVSFLEADLFPLLSVLEIENCNSLRYLPVRMKHTESCLHSLRIKDCDSLPFIVKGQLPSSLKKLSVMSCKNLQFVLNDREDDSTSSAMQKENTDSTSPSLLEHLSISNCPSLTCLSSRGQLPASLKYLGIRGCRELTTLSERGQLPAALKHIEISGCSELTNLSSGGQLPEALQHLNIADCCNLESVAKRFHNNRSLEFLLIRNCKSLESIPEGLHNLSSLRSIYIWDCPRFLSFPEAGLPNTSLTIVSIERCNKVEALPNRMHNINSLKELVIWGCPSIRSFPDQGFPTNLTSLSISDPNIYNLLLNWGFNQLAILESLEIRGCCPDAVSFPQEEMGMILPTTLTRLSIHGFPKLKYLSSVGFKNLSSLEDLSISYCPELISFPKVGLPSSLLQLYISGCDSLKNHCKRGTGKYWSMIADIPRVRIDARFIYDQE